MALDQSLILALILLRLGVWGELPGGGGGERREVKFIKGLFCAKHSARGFIFIISFYLNSNSIKEIPFFFFFLPLSYREGKEAQRG